VVTDADDGAWWLAGDGKWHEGTPPSGWVQASDRRWYPDEPPEAAKGYARKVASARGHTATVLALGRSPDPPALEAADGDDAGEGDGLAWSSDDPASGLDDDGIEGKRRRHVWVLVSVLVVLLVAAMGVVGVMAQTDDRIDGATGPSVDTAPPSSAPPNSTTTATATTGEGGPLAPAVTVAPPVSRSSTTVPRRPSTTVSPRPSTTVPPPDTTIAPPSTTPNPGGPPVREGGRCSDVGATAVTSNGTPVTCSTTACNGDSYDQPRWRRTIC
jgi:hypothetical protein